MHIPVLQKEVVKCLDPKPNENFIDATIDGGGHALAILEKIGRRGKVLGIDADPEILKNTKYKIQDTKYRNRLILVCDNFVNLKQVVEKHKFKEAQGILFDLGMSSWHLEESGRGFTFQKKEPLDMRYSSENQLTAEKIINFWSKFEIEKILKEYGEERFARNIAEKVIEERKLKPIQNTFQLVEAVKKAMPRRYLHQKIHPATRTFQALRIAVNDELNNLKKALPQALEILIPKGRVVVISFHSLEDRIVKNFFRERAKEGQLQILTKKPVIPSVKEFQINPRCRSAKLRAAQKI